MYSKWQNAFWCFWNKHISCCTEVICNCWWFEMYQQVKILWQLDVDLFYRGNGSTFCCIFVLFGNKFSSVKNCANAILSRYVIVHHLQCINIFWACVRVLLNLFVFNKSLLKTCTLYHNCFLNLTYLS